MLLPPEESWSEERRQLAQTYINAASSSLITLHHLSEAEKQSLTDGLTGLYNRRSLDQLLSREVALAERHGVPLSVVMLDMDKFKQINDTHGHAAGDHLLKAFADCVRITLRKTDLAFRYGGDEFVIVLPDTGTELAGQVAERIRQKILRHNFNGGRRLQLSLTASFGVAAFPKHASSPQQLIACADTAMYEAKAANKNCVRFAADLASKEPATRAATNFENTDHTDIRDSQPVSV
jgi:diguanylate cyclase (GGDEF)-like protein